MKINIPLPFGYNFFISINRMPSLYTFGITNRTKDNYFVFFADYDNVELDVVKEDMEFLQKNYDIGPMLINVSSLSPDAGNKVGNYHLIGFRLYTFPEVKKLIELTRCDDHFKYGYNYQQRCWVLRVGEKINKNAKTVKSRVKYLELFPHDIRDKNAKLSGGHIKFYSLLFNRNFAKTIKRFKNNNIMKTDIELIDYVTR